MHRTSNPEPYFKQTRVPIGTSTMKATKIRLGKESARLGRLCDLAVLQEAHTVKGRSQRKKAKRPSMDAIDIADEDGSRESPCPRSCP